MRRFLRSLWGVILAACLVGCVASGPGGKTSFVVVPTSQEVAIGQAMAQEIANT